MSCKSPTSDASEVPKIVTGLSSFSWYQKQENCFSSWIIKMELVKIKTLKFETMTVFFCFIPPEYNDFRSESSIRL